MLCCKMCHILNLKLNCLLSFPSGDNFSSSFLEGTYSWEKVAFPLTKVSYPSVPLIQGGFFLDVQRISILGFSGLRAVQ